jgi:hypothetical protein
MFWGISSEALILNKAIFHHLPKEENPFYHI